MVRVTTKGKRGPKGNLVAVTLGLFEKCSGISGERERERERESGEKCSGDTIAAYGGKKAKTTTDTHI